MMKFKSEFDKFITQLSQKILKYNEKDTNIDKSPDTIQVIPGNIYLKIFIGNSGRFMFNTNNGNLYLVTGYGIPDIEKCFGYLPDIVEKDFNWDGYTITPLDFHGKAQNGFYSPIAQEIMESKIAKDYIDIIRFAKDQNIIHGNSYFKITGDKLIVVDIQPQYTKGFGFTPEQFALSLKKFKGDIIYFYNGTLMNLDKEHDIKNWIKNSANDFSEEMDEFLNRIIWVEKGYGFIRDLDNNVAEEYIQAILLYLMNNYHFSTDELTDEDIQNMELPDKIKTELKNEDIVIALPNFDFNILKDFDGATIIGGAEDKQCLWEIMVLMNTLGLSYNRYEKLIF